MVGFEMYVLPFLTRIRDKDGGAELFKETDYSNRSATEGHRASGAGEECVHKELHPFDQRIRR